MKNKVRSSSIGIMLSPITKCFLLGISFPYMLHTAKESTLWGFLLGCILSIIPFSLLLFVFNQDASETIIGKLKKNFSKPVYYFLSYLITLIALFMSFILLWSLNTFISNEFLTETPAMFILILVSLPVLYLTINNFQVLSRFTAISIYIGLFLLAFNFFGLLPNFDLNNVVPFLKMNVGGVFKSAVHFTVISIAPCFLLTTLSKNEIAENEKFKRHMWAFFIHASLMSFLIFSAVQLSLNVNVLTRYTYPEFVVLKLINMFNFLDTVENFSALLWFIYLTIVIGLCTIFVKRCLMEMYNVKKKKHDLVLSIIIVLSIFAFCLPMINYSYYLDSMNIALIPFYTCLVLLGIFILLIIKYVIKKFKRN